MGGGQGGAVGISDVSAGPVVGGYYTVLNTLKRKQKQLKDLANYLKYFCSVEQCSQSNQNSLTAERAGVLHARESSHD